MCFRFFWPSAAMTPSRWCKDKLMYFASFNVVPNAFVFPMRSELINWSLQPSNWSYPAKSTKCSLDLLILSVPSFFASMYTVNIQWDLVEAWFMAVSATMRLVSPRKASLKAEEPEKRTLQDCCLLLVNSPGAYWVQPIATRLPNLLVG